MDGGNKAPETYDVAVDFMDMTDDHCLWARSADTRPGLDAIVRRHVVVGDDDADPRVARIVRSTPMATSNSRSSRAPSPKVWLKDDRAAFGRGEDDAVIVGPSAQGEAFVELRPPTRRRTSTAGS